MLLGGCSAARTQNQAAEIAGTYAAADTETAIETAAPKETAETDAPQIAAYSFSRDTVKTTGITDGGVNYFSFHKTSEVYKDEEDRDLLKEVLTEPVFYSEDPALQDWVSGVVEDIYASDVQFGRDMLFFAQQDLMQAPEAFYCYSHYVSMEVRRHDDQVISLLSLSSAYSGGEHPNSVQTAHNLDLVNCKVLSLEDVIHQEQAAAFTELVKSAVDEKYSAWGEDVLFKDYAKTVAGALKYGNMTPYWYFGEKGLIVYFNQYELGPYAGGITKVLVRYEDMTGILREEYMPEEYRGTVTDVFLTREPAEGEWIYYVDFSPGETVYISIAGTAYHVQLSETFYAEQTSVDESVMFSVNRMDDAMTIAVTGDLSNPDRTYAVEYYDELGGPYVVYVQGSDILDELPE